MLKLTGPYDSANDVYISNDGCREGMRISSLCKEHVILKLVVVEGINIAYNNRVLCYLTDGELNKTTIKSAGFELDIRRNIAKHLSS